MAKPGSESSKKTATETWRKKSGKAPVLPPKAKKGGSGTGSSGDNKK